MYLKQLKDVTRAARPSLKKSNGGQLEFLRSTDLERSTHLMTSITQEMSAIRLEEEDKLIRLCSIEEGRGTRDGTNLVKGAATDASASESEIPTSAALRAPQSLAPSPQKQT